MNGIRLEIKYFKWIQIRILDKERPLHFDCCGIFPVFKMW